MLKDFSIKFSSTIGKLKEGDWLRWFHKISMALRAQRGWGYVDGITVVPKDTQGLSEWNATNDQIMSTLGTMVKASLQRKLKSIKNTKRAWDKLKEKMHSKGIISKLECLTSAIHNCITSDAPASTTIMEIKDTLGLVFEGGTLTSEEWLIGLLLNSLSDGNYDWLRKDLLCYMMNTKMTITSEDIIEWIVTKHFKGMRAAESALAAKQWMHPKPKPKHCTNCKRTNHMVSECWEEGGGNHANAPNWIKKNNGDKSKKKKNKDKAYVLKDDSGSETTATALHPIKPGHLDRLLAPLSDCIEDGHMSYIA